MKSITKIFLSLAFFAGVLASCTTVHDVSQPNEKGQYYMTSSTWYVVFSTHKVERCETTGTGTIACTDLDIQFTGGTF